VTIDAKWARYVISENPNLYYPIHSVIKVPIKIHMVIALKIASWGHIHNQGTQKDNITKKDDFFPMNSRQSGHWIPGCIPWFIPASDLDTWPTLQ
jgi:hypothetical protein